jgi:hypothetical protein
MLKLKSFEIITEEEFTDILKNKVPVEPCPGWLDIVRMFPCMHVDCNAITAGTAHHVYSAGGGMKCDDHLTVPLCIWCHLFNKDPFQTMTSEQFKIAIGMSQDDACWRMYRLITDKYYNGDLSF